MKLLFVQLLLLSLLLSYYHYNYQDYISYIIISIIISNIIIVIIINKKETYIVQTSGAKDEKTIFLSLPCWNTVFSTYNNKQQRLCHAKTTYNNTVFTMLKYNL